MSCILGKYWHVVYALITDSVAVAYIVEYLNASNWLSLLSMLLAF